MNLRNMVMAVYADSTLHKDRYVTIGWNIHKISSSSIIATFCPIGAFSSGRNLMLEKGRNVVVIREELNLHAIIVLCS